MSISRDKTQGIVALSPERVVAGHSGGQAHAPPQCQQVDVQMAAAPGLLLGRLHAGVPGVAIERDALLDGGRCGAVDGLPHPLPPARDDCKYLHAAQIRSAVLAGPISCQLRQADSGHHTHCTSVIPTAHRL
jgi:hypothetical protein